jgi:flavin-dependent dehydrogenase
MHFDVAIAGAGPAGSACAISLRTHAPSLSVALIEASHFEEPRHGETLSPAARPMLEHLGVLDAFRAAGHAEVHGTAAAWGGEAVQENDYLFLARGPGWHLDRARFDAFLAEQAANRGATLLLDTSLREAVRKDDGWDVSLSTGGALSAGFLVDATGNATIATRFCGAQVQPVDHLVSFGRFFDDVADADRRTVVESFEDGWWYTAALPGASRFVACMTDGRIARRLHLHDESSWHQMLASMPLLSRVVRDAVPRTPIAARACGSQRLDTVAGPGWLAAGDAASRLDPLSSAGITKALRSGTFASYAIAERDPIGLRRYSHYIRSEFDAYLQTRAKMYAEEGRWRGQEFWKGRAGA